jgi:polysaccharide export outer membrane protein
MRRFCSLSFVSTLGVLAVSACASSVSGGFVWADALTTEAPATTYVIGAGDQIAVQVWDNEKMSVRTRVRSDGRISVPLVGELTVEGKSPEQVGTELEGKLSSAKLVLSPRVTVIVEDARPLSVSVLGKVSRAGTYTFATGAGVADALASAGGLNEFAHKDRIFVVRRTPEPVRIRFRFDQLFDQSHGSSAFRLKTGDVVMVD